MPSLTSYSRAALVLAVLLLPNMLNTAQAQRTIYIEPPSPQTLAKHFLPQRYRTVSMTDTDEVAAQQDGFGMLINFELNSAQILPKSLPLLESVGQMLELPRVAGRVLVIAGHADARGSYAHNQALSERRAHAIKTYLVESFGIDSERLLAIGYGEHQLYDAGDPLSGINRRVEFREAAGISVQ